MCNRKGVGPAYVNLAITDSALLLIEAGCRSYWLLVATLQGGETLLLHQETSEKTNVEGCRKGSAKYIETSCSMQAAAMDFLSIHPFAHPHTST